MNSINLMDLVKANGLKYEFVEEGNVWVSRFSLANPIHLESNLRPEVIVDQNSFDQIPKNTIGYRFIIVGINFHNSTLVLDSSDIEVSAFFENCTFKEGVIQRRFNLTHIHFNSCKFENRWIEGVFTNSIHFSNCEFRNINHPNQIISKSKIGLHSAIFNRGVFQITNCSTLELSGSCSFTNLKWKIGTIERLVISGGADFNESIIHIDSWIENCDLGYKAFSNAKLFIDPWHELRDKYTGFNLYIVTFFTTTFFLPYLLKTGSYLFAAKVSQGHLSVEDYSSLWKVLFPLSSNPLIIIHTTFGILMIVYNLARFQLTNTVNSNREREEHLVQMGVSHSRPPKNQLAAMLKWHKRLKVFWYLAIASIAYRIIDSLFIPVPDPEKFFK